MLTDSGLRSTYPPACYADVETVCVNGTLLIRSTGVPWRVLHAINERPASERMKRDGYLCRKGPPAPEKAPCSKARAHRQSRFASGTPRHRNPLRSAAIRRDPSQQCHTAVAAMKGIGHFFAVSNRVK